MFRQHYSGCVGTGGFSRRLLFTRTRLVGRAVTSRDERQGSFTVGNLQGLRCITAMKTPYLSSGLIDIPTFDRLVEAQIAGGTDGLIIGGTTGEGQLMDWDEHIMLIAHTAQVFGDRICVIGNTGSNSTSEAVHATSQGFNVGMHAALQVNPYYGKTSDAGLVAHFKEVLQFGPTMVYNVPGRTGQDIKPKVMFDLATHINFAGIKECVGNERIQQYSSEGICCWSGNDDQCHDARYDYGAVGVVSVVSNIIPGAMHRLLYGGPNPELRDRLLPLIDWLFAEPNPIGVNTALAMTGAVRPVFRLPYVPYSKERREDGTRLVNSLAAFMNTGEGGEECGVPGAAKDCKEVIEDIVSGRVARRTDGAAPVAVPLADGDFCVVGAYRH